MNPSSDAWPTATSSPYPRPGTRRADVRDVGPDLQAARVAAELRRLLEISAR
jgi:hypothetical protein